MKILLASLMCGLLSTLQCFAIDGGPWGNGTAQTLFGNYAGALTPVIENVNGVPFPEDNSLGLFSLALQTSGLGNGVTVIFRNGILYTGTTTGTGDPTSGHLNAIFSGSFQQISVSIGSDNAVQITSYYNAVGKTQTGKATIQGGRISGLASITYTNIRNDGGPPDPNGDSGGPINYNVIGFIQSGTSG